MKAEQLLCYGEDINTDVSMQFDPGTVERRHIIGDPKGVHRLFITIGDFKVELTPTKALSIRNVSYKGRQMFWEPPYEHLPDPKKMNLNDAVYIDGKKISGLAWIRYFAAHVEMLGLYNWGMPHQTDKETVCLHGNVSNIPLRQVEISKHPDYIEVQGTFYVNDNATIAIGLSRDNAEFEITKRVQILFDSPTIRVKDSIRNLSSQPKIPDWGYHVQLRAEEGACYMIPSRRVSDREKKMVPADHEAWRPAKITSVREECGYIHKGLKLENLFPDRSLGYKTLIKYPDGQGTLCVLPPSPYTQSWFSCGGANGIDFLLENKEGIPTEKFLFKNWDGVGPEIGASALDHDGNTDPEIHPIELQPDETIDLQIILEFLDEEVTSTVEEEIRAYNEERILC